MSPADHDKPKQDFPVAGERCEAGLQNPIPTPLAFENLTQFSDWIDQQLLMLETMHRRFETVTSIRGHFGR